jgi:hypothetical protein
MDLNAISFSVSGDYFRATLSTSATIARPARNSLGQRDLLGSNFFHLSTSKSCERLRTDDDLWHIKLNSDDKPVVAVVDVEGSQPSFTETDKEEISAYFFGRPVPEISVQIAHSQDFNRRDHDRAPDYVNERGTRFWMFHLSN